MKKAIRFCSDIGCFALDFPKFTCAFRTNFCTERCYNIKIRRRFEDAMNRRDYENLKAWNNCTVSDFINALSGKRTRQTTRFRFATRGEALYSSQNILKIRDIAGAISNTIFWIPTRAWRNSIRRAEIMTHLFPLPNIRVMASLDPSNSINEINELKSDNWSTIFFGDNDQTTHRIKCIKTWDHIKGACAFCKNGCFSKDRVDIHLKEH